MNQSGSILFFTLYLAFTPVIFILWFTYYKREKKKFSPGFLILLVVLGALAVLPAGYLEYKASNILPAQLSQCIFSDCDPNKNNNIVQIALGSFLVVALIEETAKFIFLFLLVQKSKVINRIKDGVRYGALFGMGFAGLENGIYLFDAFYHQEFNQLFIIFSLRFLVSSIAHAIYGAAMGYFLTKYKFANPLWRKGALVSAFLAPIAIHGLFDFFVNTQTGFYAVFLVAGAFTLFLSVLENPQAKESYRKNKKLGILETHPSDEFQVNSQQMMRVNQILYTCPLCHNKNILGAEFCSQCGYALV